MDFDFLVGVAAFYATAYIVKVISDNRVRQKLIDKNMVKADVKFLFAQRPEAQSSGVLKWALLCIGIGFAFLIKQFFPETLSEAGVAGLIFLFAGIGFLIYHFLARGSYEQDTSKKL